MREIPRIAGRPVQARLRGRHQTEFRACALSKNGQAGIEKTPGERAAVVSHLIPKERCAEGGLCALEQIEVFEEKGHTGESAVGKSTLDLAPGEIVMLHHDRIDLRVDPGRACEGFIQEFGWRHLLVAYESS